MTTLQKVMTTFTLVAVARADPTLTSSECWGYGFLTGFGVSMVGFLAALILICLQKCLTEGCFKIFVNQLYALACGAIIGDAIIHILSEAFQSEQTNKEYVSLIFICAILFFIILERIFKGLGIAHQHWGEDQNNHQHDQNSKKENEKTPTKERPDVEVLHGQINSQSKLNQVRSSNVIMNTSQKVAIQDVAQGTKDQESSNQQKSCLENLKGKGAAGYLNLLSSFVHNFFDGFGIGVGFASADKDVIIPIIIAIFAHEIPRQMGDVGILMKNGFSSMQTVLCNGFINFMSLFGVIAGLGIGSISDQAQNYVLVFVAGNFVYIGADIWRHLLNNKRMILNFVEILMFCIGVGSMFLVLLAQGSEEQEASTE